MRFRSGDVQRRLVCPGEVVARAIEVQVWQKSEAGIQRIPVARQQQVVLGHVLCVAVDVKIGHRPQSTQAGEVAEQAHDVPECRVLVGKEPFLKKLDLDTVKIIPTVLLLKSVGMARYITRNLKHIHIPEPMVEQIQKSRDKVQACIQIAAKTVNALKQRGFSGVLLSTMGWEDKLPDILRQAEGD